MPVYDRPDAAAVLELVRDRRGQDPIAQLDSVAQRAVSRSSATRMAYPTGDGVLFDSRAWIVTARRPMREAAHRSGSI